jgi:hypothetical protein
VKIQVAWTTTRNADADVSVKNEIFELNADGSKGPSSRGTGD